MSIDKQFPLVNNVATGLRTRVPNQPVRNGTRIVGFCTAVSLLFAKKCLEVPTWFPHARKDAPWDDGFAQVMMHKLNTLNADANGLAETAGLKQTMGFKNITTAEQLVSELGQTDSKVGIFWNSCHTIGIKQGQRGNSLELRVWDQNFGFFTMETSELGSYYNARYPTSGSGGANQLAGFLGLAI
jgi:hypothetical protein